MPNINKKPYRTEVKNFRINFGKYKNMDAETLVKTDIQYAQWLIDKSNLNYYNKKYLKHLIENNTDFKLSFGKYKHQNVSEVIKKDKRYLQWVYDNVKMANYEKQILEKLLINYNI